MLLTVAEKKLLLKIINKQRKQLFMSRKKKRQLKEIMLKIEQNIRNIEVNELYKYDEFN